MGTIGGDAGIDQHPAIAILNQPDIDMIEGEGQGQTYPQDTIGNRNRLRGFRDSFEWEFKAFGAVFSHYA